MTTTESANVYDQQDGPNVGYRQVKPTPTRDLRLMKFAENHRNPHTYYSRMMWRRILIN